MEFCVCCRRFANVMLIQVSVNRGRSFSLVLLLDATKVSAYCLNPNIDKHFLMKYLNVLIVKFVVILEFRL